MRTFTLTQKHIALLAHAWVRWDDSMNGAPCIDAKRPYGNSDLIDDMLGIFGREPALVDEWGDVTPTPEQVREMAALHRETETALQIILATSTFEPGVYECKEYGIAWRRVGR